MGLIILKGLALSMLTFILAWNVLYWGIVSGVCLIFMDLEFMYAYPDGDENVGKSFLIGLSFCFAVVSSVIEFVEYIDSNTK